MTKDEEHRKILNDWLVRDVYPFTAAEFYAPDPSWVPPTRWQRFKMKLSRLRDLQFPFGWRGLFDDGGCKCSCHWDD